MSPADDLLAEKEIRAPVKSARLELRLRLREIDKRTVLPVLLSATPCQHTMRFGQMTMTI